MNTCETRGMNSDYKDKSRRAECITVQTTSIVGKKVEDCFRDSETPRFLSALKSHVLFPARAGALLCSQMRTVVSGSETEKLWKK